ncbi:hypothetical protein ACFX2B_021522 [Malus domestica]
MRGKTKTATNRIRLKRKRKERGREMRFIFDGGDGKQKQEEVIDHFVKQASSLNGSALGPLVTEVTSHLALFSFSEIIDVPNVLQLEGTENYVYLDVLRLFAHGTWSDYKSLQIIDYHDGRRRSGCEEGGVGFDNAFRLSNVIGEEKGGAEEERDGCPRNDKSGPTPMPSTSPVPVGSCPWDMVAMQKNKPRKQSELSRIDEHRIAKVAIAIVKATSYEDEPASEKHVREIPTLMSSSRGYIHAFCRPCRSVCRLVHRLLNDGDPVFVNEISYATRRVSLPIGFHGRTVETVERQIDGRAL